MEDLHPTGQILKQRVRQCSLPPLSKRQMREYIWQQSSKRLGEPIARKHEAVLMPCGGYPSNEHVHVISQLYRFLVKSLMACSFLGDV